MNFRKIILNILLLFLGLVAVNAQTYSKLTKEDSALFYTAMETAPKSTMLIPFINNKVDSTIRVDMLKTEAMYHNYIFTQRMAIYNWQLNSGKILFFVVVLIVLIGLYLSYLQFKASTAHQEYQRKAGASITTTNKIEVSDAVTSDPITKFEITKDGIKIDSAVIGLVILAFSIAFFFMYLNYVFPIQTQGTLPSNITKQLER